MTTPTLRSAISEINRHGALLLFPIDNRPEPLSLWRCFFPRTKMVWDWSVDGDNRVPRLWHLREELSRSGKVVYSKWYQGRATFFSLPLFTALLGTVTSRPDPHGGLSPEARTVIEALEEDSPLATKALRERTELTGKARQSAFDRAMRELWSRFLIVGYGEMEEGGYPSLAVGSTKLLFEDLWDESRELEPEKREARIADAFSGAPLFMKSYTKLAKSLAAAPVVKHREHVPEELPVDEEEDLTSYPF